MDCKHVKDLRVSKNSLGYYIYVESPAQYLHKDGSVSDFVLEKGYFSTKEDAEKVLKEFQKKPCSLGGETQNFSCDEFKVGGYGGKVYIHGPLGQYLFRDGEVRAWSEISRITEANKLVFFKTKKEAEEFLREFKKKMCKSANVVSNQPIYLQLENETSPIIQPIKARLVTDHSGERIVLQVQTPESPEFIPVARLAVKDGKVVMFREQGVESEFINTDEKGRIQN